MDLKELERAYNCDMGRKYVAWLGQCPYYWVSVPGPNGSVTYRRFDPWELPDLFVLGLLRDHEHLRSNLWFDAVRDSDYDGLGGAGNEEILAYAEGLQ